ncbi:eugenol synthase 1-like [Hibiscus syriacus]|uniref:Eugenol synthase 1-like n=1 Tax=Hibiscus syriacus TaxID=106335 RepID=A0A6A3AFX8_HIBSY|nr:eugenol synthase 1-like [Hibiscus syriacus]
MQESPSYGCNACMREQRVKAWLQSPSYGCRNLPAMDTTHAQGSRVKFGPKLGRRDCFATYKVAGSAWRPSLGKPWRRSRSPRRHGDLRSHCGFHPISANNMGSALDRELFILKALYREFNPQIVWMETLHPWVSWLSFARSMFLWVLDDAHGTFVWGKNGGGLAEEFNSEYDVDLCVGTLSKAASSLGGFVACSKIWKQWIQSRGHFFIFSTVAPIPLAAASHASVVVAKKESWRRREIRNRMKEFHALTGIPMSNILDMPCIGNFYKLVSTATLSDHQQSLQIEQEDIKRLAALISKHVKFQAPSNIDNSNYTSARL